MAEETKTMEKVYCCAPQNNDALVASLLNNSNGQNAMWNNPFAYLIWMMLLRNWNNDGNAASTAENFNSQQIAALQDTLNSNQNSNLVMDAIKGNGNAITTLASNLNCDFNALNTAVCGIRSAIEKVGGEVGFTGEKVINAANLGDLNIIQNLKDCCCGTQKEIIKGNYENQLASERQTNTLISQLAANHSADQLQGCQNHSAMISRIDQLANGVQQGFAQIGFQSQQNTQAIISNQTANTQRILDQMCANQTQELRDTIAQKDRELQTQSIINQMRNGCGCCGCN